MKKLLLAILIIILLGAGGYYNWHNDQDKSIAKNTTQSTAKSTDPSEDGKYLVIKEWNVKFPIPKSLKNGINYQLSGKITDGNESVFETAKLYISKTLDQTSCAVSAITQDKNEELNTNIMLIREQKSSPTLDISRYKGSTKAKIFSNSQFAFDLNYSTPECADSGTTILIHELEDKASQLQAY